MIDTYVALDLETTGIRPAEDRIIEIGAVKVVEGKPIDTFSTFINPQIPISARIEEITGITDAMVSGAPYIGDVIAEVVDYTEGFPLLGHNIIFDYSFLKKAAVDQKLSFERSGIDTLKIARRILPQLEKKNLSVLCEYLGIHPEHSHRALDDARSASLLYRRLNELKPQDDGFVKPIALNYSVKRDTPLTPAQRSYLISLVNYHHIRLEQPIEGLTKRQASRMIDTILSEKGRIPGR